MFKLLIALFVISFSLVGCFDSKEEESVTQPKADYDDYDSAEKDEPPSDYIDNKSGISNRSDDEESDPDDQEPDSDEP